MTEWKEAEETLKRQYLFVHHFIDAFPRPIYCLDPGRRFLECNQAFEEMVGRSRAAIIGARTVDVFPAEDRAVYEQGDDLLFLEPSTCTYEATLQFAEEGGPLTLIGNLIERGRQQP